MDGIIPLWKEKNMTSHDAVMKARRLLHEKKIGHTGTLDPSVEGVLVLCVGKATKLVSLMTEKQKHYEGTITFGIETETGDLDGKIVRQQNLKTPFSQEAIQNGMSQFIGEIEQVPPMYSAVKVNGKKLYEYAREGLEVERPIRHVHVDVFELTADNGLDEEGKQTISFRVISGKGTYVRALATDLGEKLGVPAVMSQLIRTEVSPYNQDDALTLKEMEEKLAQNDFSFLRPLESSLSTYPIWQVPKAQQQLVRNGGVLRKDQLPKTLPVRAKIGEELIALYDEHPKDKKAVKPVVMF